MRTVDVVLLTKQDCALCEGAKAMLERLGSEFPLKLRLVPLDSSEGEDLATRNGFVFPPGILLDGKPFSHGRPSEGKLRRQLQLLIGPASVTPQVER